VFSSACEFNSDILTDYRKHPKLTPEWAQWQKELHNLWASLNIIRVMKSRRMRWTGHVVRMEGMGNVNKISVAKPEGKTPLGRPWRWWEDDIREAFWEIGWESVDWMHLTQDRNQWRIVMKMIITFGLHKRRGNLNEWLLASQGLYSMESVSQSLKHF